MQNFELESEEVILYEDFVNSNEFKGHLKLTLTSQKIIFEKEKGLFKKELNLVDIIFLENIKFYNDKVQIKQKGSNVIIQTTNKNITISFSDILKARKFVNNVIDTITGTTIAKRGSNKIKDAFNIVDDTLGLDTRGTIKGLVENGVKNTILNGIKKNK